MTLSVPFAITQQSIDCWLISCVLVLRPVVVFACDPRSRSDRFMDLLPTSPQSTSYFAVFGIYRHRCLFFCLLLPHLLSRNLFLFSSAERKSLSCDSKASFVTLARPSPSPSRAPALQRSSARSSARSCGWNFRLVGSSSALSYQPTGLRSSTQIVFGHNASAHRTSHTAQAIGSRPPPVPRLTNPRASRTWLCRVKLCEQEVCAH